MTASRSARRTRWAGCRARTPARATTSSWPTARCTAPTRSPGGLAMPVRCSTTHRARAPRPSPIAASPAMWCELRRRAARRRHRDDGHHRAAGRGAGQPRVGGPAPGDQRPRRHRAVRAGSGQHRGQQRAVAGHAAATGAARAVRPGPPHAWPGQSCSGCHGVDGARCPGERQAFEQQRNGATCPLAEHEALAAGPSRHHAQRPAIFAPIVGAP